ncbi:MAG: hypothetical protein LBS01_02025 [Prevotellaceae bacterium]|jgi:hypothetical protein|nr:hypothetical protein [Prevotellaceae bacterium]
MAVNYVVVPKGNPADPNAPKKFYAQAISSGGAETEDKFHLSLIKNPKVAFRPGVDLKEMLATLKYEKAK